MIESAAEKIMAYLIYAKLRTKHIDAGKDKAVNIISLEHFAPL